MRLNASAKSYVNDKEVTNYFDMGAKRFQPGFDFGGELNFFFLCLRYKYTKDLTDFIPGTNSKASHHSITIGGLFPPYW